MRKPPRPFYKKSHQCWYLAIQGRQFRLDPDKDKAWQRYYELMGRRGIVEPGDPTVQHLLNQFILWTKDHRSVGTLHLHTGYCKAFGKFVGPVLKVSELKPFHLSRWVDNLYTPAGNPNSRRNAMRTIQRCLNWALDEGLVAASPLARVKKPTATPRDCDLTVEQYHELVAAIEDENFRDYVRFLALTGSRTKESRLITVEMFDRAGGRLTIPASLAKGGVERVITLDPEALAIIQRRGLKYGNGPLFRNSYGKAWSCQAVVKQFEKLSIKLDYAVKASWFRHVWITLLLTAGVDSVTVATLAGHKDLKMIQSVYNKLRKRDEHLRASLEQGLKELQQDREVA